MRLTYHVHFRCKEEVQRFLTDTDRDSCVQVGADMMMIQECFRLLKVITHTHTHTHTHTKLMVFREPLANVHWTKPVTSQEILPARSVVCNLKRIEHCKAFLFKSKCFVCELARGSGARREGLRERASGR